MSADGPEPKPSESKQGKRATFCKIPYPDIIFWDPLQRQAARWVRFGPLISISFVISILSIVWWLWPSEQWIKPGETEAQMKEDRHSCRSIAIKDDSFVGITRGSKYASTYKTCMQSKGYTLTK